MFLEDYAEELEMELDETKGKLEETERISKKLHKNLSKILDVLYEKNKKIREKAEEIWETPDLDQISKLALDIKEISDDIEVILSASDRRELEQC